MDTPIVPSVAKTPLPALYNNIPHVCALEGGGGAGDAPAGTGWLRWICHRVRASVLAGHWTRGGVRVLSRRALRLERARQLRTNRWVLVHPYSPFRFYWDCLFFSFTLLVFLYMPFQTFIRYENRYDPLILFCDAITFVDIGINLITGYNDEWQKVVVLEPRRIVAHYARRGLICELLGALPLQLIKTFPHMHTVFFLPKLLRFGAFAEKWKVIREQLDMSYITISIMAIAGVMVLFLHWATYLYYQVPKFVLTYFHPKDERYKRWFKRQLITEKSSTFQRYVTSLYSVCGLSIGVGYYRPINENITEELLLSALISFLGLLFLTYEFMTLLKLQMYRNYPTYLYNGRFKELEKYMASKNLPATLRQKITLFVQYKFGGSYFNEQSFRDTINEPLKQDINMQSCGRLLQGVSVFRNMPVALLNSIIFTLKHRLYMPGEILVHCNQPNDSLYLIFTGTVGVFGPGGDELNQLVDGAHFGQQALLRSNFVPDASYIALEITEVYKLSNESFQDCLAPYPNIRRKLTDEGASFAQQRGNNEDAPF